jgi:hypothetical protein
MEALRFLPLNFDLLEAADSEAAAVEAKPAEDIGGGSPWLFLLGVELTGVQLEL